jgi:hypothetical protein
VISLDNMAVNSHSLFFAELSQEGFWCCWNSQRKSLKQGKVLLAEVDLPFGYIHISKIAGTAFLSNRLDNKKSHCLMH